MDLNNRRKYLFALLVVVFLNTSSFLFSNWFVYSRHPDTFLFNDHISTPKTDSFKFTVAANFPRMWAELGAELQDSAGIILFYSKSSSLY